MIAMRTTKLDMYEYDLVWTRQGRVKQVIIFVDSNRDPVIANIASSLTDTDGNIYIEGRRLVLLSGFVKKDEYGEYSYILNVTDITQKENV